MLLTSLSQGKYIFLKELKYTCPFITFEVYLNTVFLLVLENHKTVLDKVILYVVPKAVKDKSKAEVKVNT